MSLVKIITYAAIITAIVLGAFVVKSANASCYIHVDGQKIVINTSPGIITENDARGSYAGLMPRCPKYIQDSVIAQMQYQQQVLENMYPQRRGDLTNAIIAMVSSELDSMNKTPLERFDITQTVKGVADEIGANAAEVDRASKALLLKYKVKD